MVRRRRQRHRQARRGAVRAVGKVDKAEIQIRLRRQGECAKRGKIRGIAAVTRHRHMDEIHLARTRLRNAVGIGDAGGKIGGLDNMFVTGIAVTQMNARLDIHGHEAEKPGDPRGGGGQNVFIMQRHTAIGGDNFVTDIPLDGELVVGDPSGNGLNFLRQRRFDNRLGSGTYRRL